MREIGHWRNRQAANLGRLSFHAREILAKALTAKVQLSRAIQMCRQ